MSRLKYILLILINILGIIISSYSLFYTERLNSFISNSKLICDIGKTASCSVTYISDYAYLFNIPISLFALLFFWFELSVIVLNKPEKTVAPSYSLLGFINLFALAICGVYLYILIFILKNICPSCIAIDSLVLLNFVLLFKYLKEPFKKPAVNFLSFVKINFINLVSFLLLFVVGLILYKSYQGFIQKKNKIFAEEFFMHQPINIKISSCKTIIWGNSNAKTEIKIFEDFLCGYCKIASPRYREIFTKDSSNVKIEFICYPLAYNPGSNRFNIFISKVMLAASNDSQFWNFHDEVLKLSGSMDSALVMNLAVNHLNNYKIFEKNFINTNFDSIFTCNIKYAKEYNVSGTPAIYINDREFEQWTNINLLKMIINSNQHHK